jgi:hypothetical protein
LTNLERGYTNPTLVTLPTGNSMTVVTPGQKRGARR